MGVTGHWMDETFTHHDIVLDLSKLNGSHSSERLRDSLFATLDRYQIKKFLGAITCDNAAENGKLCRLIEQSGEVPNWTQIDMNIRCFNHIQNLSAQKLIKRMNGTPKESEDKMADEHA